MWAFEGAEQMLALRGQARLIIQLVATAGAIIADAAPVLKMADIREGSALICGKSHAWLC